MEPSPIPTAVPMEVDEPKGRKLAIDSEEEEERYYLDWFILKKEWICVKRMKKSTTWSGYLRKKLLV